METCWQRLIEGKCGIRALCADDLEKETLLHTLEQLPSKVVAAVPYGTGPGEFDSEYWLHSKSRIRNIWHVLYLMHCVHLKKP